MEKQEFAICKSASIESLPCMETQLKALKVWQGLLYTWAATSKQICSGEWLIKHKNS